MNFAHLEHFPKTVLLSEQKATVLGLKLIRPIYSSPWKMFWKDTFLWCLTGSHLLQTWMQCLESFDHHSRKLKAKKRVRLNLCLSSVDPHSWLSCPGPRASQQLLQQSAIISDATTCPGYHPLLVENLGCHGNKGERAIEVRWSRGCSIIVP